MAFKSFDTNITIKKPFVPDWMFNETSKSFDDYLKEQIAVENARAIQETNDLQLEKAQKSKTRDEELTKLYSDFEASDKTDPVTNEDVNKIFLKNGDIESYIKNSKQKATPDDELKTAFSLAKSDPDLASAFWDYSGLTEKTGRAKPTFSTKQSELKALTPAQKNQNRGSSGAKESLKLLFNSKGESKVVNVKDRIELEDANAQGYNSTRPSINQMQGLGSLLNQEVVEEAPKPSTFDRISEGFSSMIKSAATPSSSNTKIRILKKKAQ